MNAPERSTAPWPALAVALLTAGIVAALGDPRHAGAIAPYVLVGGGVLVLATLGRPTATRGIPLAALLVRLPLLTLPAAYSDDVYRYVWEGRVWLAGESPFVRAPDDPVLAPLRDATWALVNHREVSSIYPPLAQLLFVLLSPGGVLAWKLVAAAADVGTATLLGRRDARAGWLWALLPLPALESAGSGHLEGIGVLLLVAALGGRPWAALAGAMVKLLPAAALAPLFHERRWRTIGGMVGAGVLASIPLFLAGPALWRGFETYRQTWAYNGSLYPLAAAVFDPEPARRLLQLVGLTVAVGISVRSRDPARVALWITGAFVLLSPTVHPWYVLWPLAAALWTRTRAWELLAVGIPLAYVVLASLDPATSTWVEPTWPKLLYYPAFYAALLVEAGWILTRPNPRSVG